VLDSLRELREAADLLQSELAERLGRPQSYISSAERRARGHPVGALQLADWAEACGSILTGLAQIIDVK